MATGSKCIKRKSDENQDGKLAVKLTSKEIKTTSVKKPRIINPIKINLTTQEKSSELPKKSDEKVKEVFNSDDETDEEEIPTEARIRMRNLGRYTPTSCGPNSFGKSRFGFVDRRALLNKQTEALNSAVSED